MAQVFEGLGIAGLGLGWWNHVHRCGDYFVEGVGMSKEAMKRRLNNAKHKEGVMFYASMPPLHERKHMSKQTEALKLALHVMRNQGDIGVDEWLAAEKTILEALEKEALHKLAAESLNEGLRLDDWDKIGCVNHDCDKCKSQQEPVPCCGKYETCTQACTPRGRFLGKREALAEQTAQQEPVENVELDVAVLRQQLLGRAEFLRDRGEIKSPQLMEMAAELIYTTPQAQPAREPLTHEQINKAAEDEDNETAFLVGFYAGARFAEAAHGITKGNT